MWQWLVMNWVVCCDNVDDAITVNFVVPEAVLQSAIMSFDSLS